MVCPPCVAASMIAGGSGVAGFFRKNEKMVYLGSIMVVLGVLAVPKRPKGCDSCKQSA